MQGTKELLNHSRDHTVEDSMCLPLPPRRVCALVLTIADLRYTGVWNAAALQTDDVAAALMSGLQKRKPTFEKL